MIKRTAIAIALAGGAAITGVAVGSSHREAPLITETPKVDNTDVYMFRSYEEGREGYVTLIANFQPFQDPYGGPNYFTMDPDAMYSIHVDSDGNSVEDLAFHFRFANNYRNIWIPVNGVQVPVPLRNIGPFGAAAQASNNNLREVYSLVTVRNRTEISPATNLSFGGGNVFIKPSDYIGEKSIPGYAAYADRHIYDVGLAGCAGDARVFVGQRREGFSVNVGEVFDLINTNPLGARDGEENVLADKNVTTIALEVPISCMTEGSDPVIGAWSTASLETSNGRFTQVSRLSAPLVNEVVIGLPDKDSFNNSFPWNDAYFARYVTHPTLPELIQALYPTVTAPNQFPRTDLVAAFLTGLPGLNQPANIRPAEMMRLNTAIAPAAAAAQDSLGALAGDAAGFPNGRRPGDDVVDIELRVAMGALLPADVAPSGQLPYTDGAIVAATDFRDTFPYLNTPLAGSPNTAGAPGGVAN
ncbi:DUF4331 domain-containing protein [Novilysobacter erysipheiresistens]